MATNVRNERLLREWTQQTLGEEAGISMRQVGQIESAKPATSVDVIEKLASAFKITESDLLKRR